MIVRLAQLPIRGSWKACMDRAVEAAVKKPAPDVLILPELFTTGFDPEIVKSSTLSVQDLRDLPLGAAARENNIWIVGGTLPVRINPRGTVNMLPVYAPTGELVHTTEKVHLFRNMGEHTMFAPGEPSGVFNLSGITAGASVCYDLRFPELFRRHALMGAEIMLLPAQWPAPRLELFRSLLRSRAAEAQVFVAGCNLGGEHLGVRFHGGGGVADPSGKLLESDRIDEYTDDFTVDVGEVERIRSRINCLQDRRPEVYGGGE